MFLRKLWYWFRSYYPLDATWDRLFNDLMDKHKFELEGQFSARLGSVVVWTANEGYADMHPYEPEFNVRPFYTTYLRARKKIQEDLLQ